jgi:hypothetical protein
MQKIIGRILEGNFEYEDGSLDFSCEKIELTLKKGELCEGSFHIYALPGQFAEGRIISSDRRMLCMTDTFSGTDREIFFRFHGDTLEEGDVVKGSFYIISNRGEYYLPFVASVEHTVPEFSGGKVKNLFQFAELAKNNWQEAVKMFYLPEFCCVFSGSDAKYGEDYRALSAVEGREQNVEEFLLQTGRKQKVEFLVEESHICVEADVIGSSVGVMEREVHIVRNGWGYTRLAVECQGEFLFTEKEALTDDDFLGNRCVLPVFFDMNLCRRGRRFGRIILRHPYGELAISVEIRLVSAGIPGSQLLSEKQYTIQLMKLYEAFRLKKIETSAWLKETGRLVEGMVAMDEEDIGARLFQAQLLITEKRLHEAGWILDYVSDLFEKRPPEDVLLAYYLYLTTLLRGDADYIVQVAGRVERIYQRDISNWRVAWLLLYLSETYQRSDRERWGFLEELFAMGCISPVLYIEAVILLNGNPSLLRKLGRFEQQVLYYGVKQGALRREVEELVGGLAGRSKEASEVLCRLLAALYEKPDRGNSMEKKRLLQELCTLLIKRGKAGSRYFGWYQAGVEAQLRITNLYEYYMLSLDLDEKASMEAVEIPKTVIMYFSYQSRMDYVRTSYLYDYLLRHRVQLGETYHAYRPRMEQFIIEQIKKGHINKYLANLYQKLLRQDMLDEKTAGPFSRLLFAHFIRVTDGRIQKVYVYQPGNLRPSEYVLTDKSTWVALYGSKYTIVFEDARRNRYMTNVEYTIEKLMIPGRFLRWLLPLEFHNPELDFYLCDNNCVYKKELSGGIERKLRVAASESADPKIRAELYLHILEYYHGQNDLRAMGQYLEEIPSRGLTAKQRGIVFQYMAVCGRYDLAGKWLEVYGAYSVDAKVVLQLLGPLMEQWGMSENPVLTAAAAYAFRKGQYDSTTLAYLAMHYRGMVKNLRDIWKTARSFGVNCGALCERILIQMLYSGAYVGETMEIFRYHIDMGANSQLEKAFLAQCAYDYFVRERVTEKEVFREIERMYLSGEPVQKICKLAYSKYELEVKSEADEAGEAVRDAMLEAFLTDLINEGVRLEFFKKYGKCSLVSEELADKTILEYRTSPRAKARVHYVIPGQEGQPEGYMTESMKEAFAGVFFKEFVLFFGESLQYYITEEWDGEEQLTESGTLEGGGDDVGEDSRYRLINDIVIHKSLQEYSAMDDLLEEYYRKDFLNGRLFELK